MINGAELRNCDPEDVEELIFQLEDSLGIRFEHNDFAEVLTFGAMTNVISGKINLQHADDCTLQQAFYKLRTAIAFDHRITTRYIHPQTALNVLFPLSTRYHSWKRIQKVTGIRLDIFSAPSWLVATSLILVATAFGCLFVQALLALVPLMFIFLLFRLVYPYCCKFNVDTLGALTRLMVSRHYLKSRRNPATYNKHELISVLQEHFSHGLAIDKRMLTPQATFN